MNPGECYDRQGQPLTVDQAADRLGDIAYRLVARDIWDNIIVSTVWTGFPHGADDQGRPLIFETMIFGGPWNGLQWHWATQTEAVTAHNRVAAELLTKLGHEHDQTRRKDQRHPGDMDTHRRRH